jgi:hypothetical protein
MPADIVNDQFGAGDFARCEFSRPARSSTPRMSCRTLKAMEAYAATPSIANIEAWLFRIAHNAALDLSRATAAARIGSRA